MKRFQARRGNGRFTRNTLENTMGLTNQTCPNFDCRRLNVRGVHEAPRTHCHACGTLLGAAGGHYGHPPDVNPERQKIFDLQRRHRDEVRSLYEGKLVEIFVVRDGQVSQGRLEGQVKQRGRKWITLVGGKRFSLNGISEGGINLQHGGDFRVICAQDAGWTPEKVELLFKRPPPEPTHDEVIAERRRRGLPEEFDPAPPHDYRPPKPAPGGGTYTTDLPHNMDQAARLTGREYEEAPDGE